MGQLEHPHPQDDLPAFLSLMTLYAASAMAPNTTIQMITVGMYSINSPYFLTAPRRRSIKSANTITIAVAINPGTLRLPIIALPI